MSTEQVDRDAAGGSATAAVLGMQLEVVVIPVSDVDRARDFYEGLGWRLDADVTTPAGLRLVQLTPPGSGCSIQFGTHLTTAAPGSLQSSYLVVADIVAARERLVGIGIDVTEVFHCETGFACRFGGASASGRVLGRGPADGSYSSFAAFRDPDGNGWLLQEVTTRLPGRVAPAATLFASADDLREALKRAAAAHGEHETRTGQADADWPTWYADYMVREQAGEELPT